MEDRLCGREQEFGMRMSRPPKFSNLGPGDIDDFFCRIFKSILAEFGSKYESIGITERGMHEAPGSNHFTGDNFWFANGLRAYIDQQILEVSTPEHRPCGLDSVLYEKASERMLNVALDSFLGKNPRYGSISLYKNNISYDPESDNLKENSYGSHQNYSCRQKSVGRISAVLKNFLPAALPLTGSGHILYSDSGATYCYSQRASHIHLIAGDDTVNSRALINDRGFGGNDTLMPENGLARLHLISCDATRCEFQTWLVEGIFHLIIRLAEEGWQMPKNAYLHKPVLNLKNLNVSVGLDCHMTMTNGRNIKSRDYLKIFLKAAKQLKPLSDQEKKCISEWENVLELSADRTGQKLVGKLDWATKLHLLKNQMKKKGFKLGDGRALRINMEYHNISSDPRRSWFARLEELGYVDRMASDADVRRAIREAPLTRAHARGKFIRKCLGAKKWRSKLGGISWGDAFWKGQAVTFGLGGDPFSTRLD